MLGAAALAAAVVTVESGAGAVHVVSNSRVGHFSLFGLNLSRPYVNVAAAVLLALAGVGLAAIAKGARAALNEARSNRRFFGSLAARNPRRQGGFFVFDDVAVQAFCAGLLRPRVYVSTGALEALSAAELDAVLAHECHHQRRHDPLRVALGRMLTRALFFLPVVSLLHARYCAMAELAADSHAISADGVPQALASALLAFGAGQESEAAVGIAPERVDHMLGRVPNWPLPAAVVAGGVAVVALIGVLASQLARMASVRASLSLPVLSARPCIAVLATLPAALTAIALLRLRRAT
jgi:Zn-dependent protease with chaperone function